ncbi:beta-mannosidase isoform 2-T2 [Discoglossus pictus]
MNTIDITSVVKEDNFIEVRIQSPVYWAMNKSQEDPNAIPPECPPKIQNGECHANFIRKAQCSFSWDWGPSFPTMGIWQDIRIEAYNVFHLDYISYIPLYDAVASQWAVKTEPVFDVITSAPVPGKVLVRIPELDVYHQQDFVLLPGNQVLEILVKISTNTSVHLWWPNGYGNQTGYVMIVKFLFDGDYSIENKTKVYFRTVELVEEPIPGSAGLSFYIKINRVPVFLKGSNWIPANSFQDRITSNKLNILLQSAIEANMNTLRVWGGGVYESDEFYNMCDELGIMVWQDFMFACALYPTDDWFLDTVQKEVIHQVRRLRSHPSIVIWSGNNENEAAMADDWFSIPTQMREFFIKGYLTLYIKIIRKLILQMDESRPFLASSPTNGQETIKEYWLAKNPYDHHYGDIHYYNYMADCWDWKTYPKARLASEYGFQSWPSLSTVDKVSVPEDWVYTSNFSSHRQHHLNGNEEMLYQAGLHYKLPINQDSAKEFQHTLYLTQVTQAQCIKLQTEFYRRSQNEIVNGEGHTMGALYWQLNDIWQAPSWSSIEYGGKWKMLHYYAKTFFAPVTTSAYEDNNTLYIYGASDLPHDQYFTLKVELYRWNSFSAVHENVTKEFVINARSSGPIYRQSIPELLEALGITRQNTVIVFYLLYEQQDYGPRNWHFLSSLKEAQGLLKPNITVTISQENKIFAFKLVTQAVAPFVWLDVWDIPGRFSDNGFLMTDEVKIVAFYPWSSTTVDELSKVVTVTTLRDIY